METNPLQWKLMFTPNDHKDLDTRFKAVMREHKLQHGANTMPDYKIIWKRKPEDPKT